MKRRGPGVLLAIGLFKLVKCAALVALGVGAFKLLRRPDAEDAARRVLGQLHVDPEGRVATRVLTFISRLTPRRLEELGAGTLFYAAVFAVEGVGLVLQKRWAEYLTVAVTGSFLPFEIYELAKGASLLKALGIVANAAIVVYLVVRLRRDRAASAGPSRPHARSRGPSRDARRRSRIPGRPAGPA